MRSTEQDGGTQASEAELADSYYNERFTDGIWGDPEPVEKPLRLEVRRTTEIRTD